MHILVAIARDHAPMVLGRPVGAACADMWYWTYAGPVTDLAALPDLRAIGDALRERRIELGWTQARLAERSGVTQADISRIENGQIDPRWSTVRRLAVALSDATEPERSLANGRRRNPPSRRGPRRVAPATTLPVTH